MTDKVLKIARELFNNDDLTIDSKIGDVEQWDSLGQINLFMALDGEFELSFDPEEVIENDSIKKITLLLKNRKNNYEK